MNPVFRTTPTLVHDLLKSRRDDAGEKGKSRKKRRSGCPKETRKTSGNSAGDGSFPEARGR